MPYVELADETRLYYELTDDLMNGYLSLSSHRLNQIMQTLTIVTVVFVPITFMAPIKPMAPDAAILGKP